MDSIHEKIRLSEKLWDKKRFELALPYHLEMVLELFAFCYGGFDTVIVLVARDLAKCNCASHMEALLDIHPHIAKTPPPCCCCSRCEFCYYCNLPVFGTKGTCLVVENCIFFG